MNKRKAFRLFTVLALCMVMVCSFSMTAFAYADDTDQNLPITEGTQPEDMPETQPEDTPSVLPEGEPIDDEGNAYTRDLLYDKATNKQFITIQTRNGKTFYIIIDYDKPLDEEGDHYETYFLNMVDEADIQALLEEAGIVVICECTDKCVAGKVNTACSICSKNMTECIGKEAEPEVKPTDPTEPSEAVEEPTGEVQPTAVLALVVVIGVVGAGIFFFIKNKKSASKTKGKTDLDNYDYGMDDEDDYAEFESYDDEDNA